MATINKPDGNKGEADPAAEAPGSDEGLGASLARQTQTTPPRQALSAALKECMWGPDRDPEEGVEGFGDEDPPPDFSTRIEAEQRILRDLAEPEFPVPLQPGVHGYLLRVALAKRQSWVERHLTQWVREQLRPNVVRAAKLVFDAMNDRLLTAPVKTFAAVADGRAAPHFDVQFESFWWEWVMPALRRTMMGFRMEGLPDQEREVVQLPWELDDPRNEVILFDRTCEYLATLIGRAEVAGIDDLRSKPQPDQATKTTSTDSVGATGGEGVAFPPISRGDRKIWSYFKAVQERPGNSELTDKELYDLVANDPDVFEDEKDEKDKKWFLKLKKNSVFSRLSRARGKLENSKYNRLKPGDAHSVVHVSQL